jgi:protein-tyrosine phosphatase
VPRARAGYWLLFTGLARSARRPALVHCTTGKDRTGWAAAALLMLLGVPDELVMREYLLTNEELVPALGPVLDRFRAGGGDPALLMPVLGVDRRYLGAALDEMAARFGTIEGYFADGLGIGADGQAALRDALVERRA